MVLIYRKENDFSRILSDILSLPINVFFWKGSYFLASERKRDMRDVGKNPTGVIRWKDSHLTTGFFPKTTERFQFVDGFC